MHASFQQFFFKIQTPSVNQFKHVSNSITRLDLDLDYFFLYLFTTGVGQPNQAKYY